MHFITQWTLISVHGWSFDVGIFIGSIVKCTKASTMVGWRYCCCPWFRPSLSSCLLRLHHKRGSNQDYISLSLIHSYIHSCSLSLSLRPCVFEANRSCQQQLDDENIYWTMPTIAPCWSTYSSFHWYYWTAALAWSSPCLKRDDSSSSTFANTRIRNSLLTILKGYSQSRQQKLLLSCIDLCTDILTSTHI